MLAVSEARHAREVEPALVLELLRTHRAHAEN